MKVLLVGTALLLSVAQETPQGRVAVQAPKGVDAAQFGKLELPNRWIVYRQSVTKHKALVFNWVLFLESRKDFELLEAIAVFEGFQQLFQKGKPGEVLYRLDAPQWMRVALWNIRQPDSHSMKAATSPLENNPRRFLGWARKFRDVKRLGGAKLIEKLAAHGATDPGDALPPLDPQTIILPFLDAPRKLATLAPTAKFEKNTRYRFQVLRAIKAVSVIAKFDEPYRGKLLRLTRHADAEVRRAAMLEFSEFPAGKVPWSELLVMSRNTALADADRQAATLAASYSNHPDVYLEVHKILRDPKHPGFDAILGRAYALSDGYMSRVLAKLPRKGLPETRRSRVSQLEKALRQAEIQRNSSNSGQSASTLLYRAAWAVHREDEQSDALLYWTRTHVKQRMAKPAFVQMMRRLEANPGTDGIPRFLHAWVRDEARRILDGK
jgi:hypothetical protein